MHTYTLTHLYTHIYTHANTYTHLYTRTHAHIFIHTHKEGDFFLFFYDLYAFPAYLIALAIASKTLRRSDKHK